MKFFFKIAFISLLLTSIITSLKTNAHWSMSSAIDQEHSELALDDAELLLLKLQKMNCKKANAQNIALVNEGNKLAVQFLTACYENTNNSPYCPELMRPNPDSRPIFHCTYGDNQPHQLIHPDPQTWAYAFKSIWLLQQLEKKNIQVCSIYNWWRPEPYNENVGGAPGRHPLGTAVDVRFCTKEDQNNAHRELCLFRKQGHLRALGYYPSTGLHLGIADEVGNTWGKACPN